MGSIIMKYGTMGTGKTLSMVCDIFNNRSNGHEVLILKPGIDSKGNDSIISRNGMNAKIDFFVDDKTDLFKLVMDFQEKHPNLTTVLIDEVQFLRDIRWDLLRIKNNLNLRIICYGLYFNFMGEIFDTTAKIVGIADEVDVLKGICTCGRDTKMVGRKSNGKFVGVGEIVVIDEGDNYIPLCPECFMKKVSHLVIKE